MIHSEPENRQKDGWKQSEEKKRKTVNVKYLQIKIMSKRQYPIKSKEEVKKLFFENNRAFEPEKCEAKTQHDYSERCRKVFDRFVNSLQKAGKISVNLGYWVTL